MSLISDCSTAAQYLRQLQSSLWQQGDHSQDEYVTAIVSMLDSPLFLQLLDLQEDSNSHDAEAGQNFIHPSGEIEEDKQVGSSALPQESLNTFGVPPFSDSTTGSSINYPETTGNTYSWEDQDLQQTIERIAAGREIETIKLFKPENSSLGFSVVGRKTEAQAEVGIYVRDLQPGGIAERDGRLKERDQILAIDGKPLNLSNNEAIKILQGAKGLVELVVARGPIPEPTQDQQGSVSGADNSQLNDDAASADMVLNTEWTQVEVIHLVNDGTGLGFGIIGGRSTGVVVKTILPGGVADMNGQLRSGDHVLQIGDVNVRGMGSEQVASVLRQAGSHVRLIVARPLMEPLPHPTAPCVPTEHLDLHLQQLNNLLENADMMGMGDEGMEPAALEEGLMHMVQMNQEYPEVNYFDVDLLKDAQGLGITIAGYVGKDNTPDELCGIFVKSVTEGSAASKDGRIQVNDQIIQVDNQLLTGFSNHEAVNVLRNTGQMVHLKLARYQHGPKYEKLQQYLSHCGMMNMAPYENTVTSTTSDTDMPAIMTPNQVIDLDDVNLTEEDYVELLPETEVAIQACWAPIIGEDFEVVVAQLSKFREGGGLGISLEGTVDVENGKEVRPHHYIRSILPDGPVGVNGRLTSGDELLEVNGKRLLGLNHKEVVGILKELPQHVRLVCARKLQRPNLFAPNDTLNEEEGVEDVTPITERLVKAKSELALASSEPAGPGLNRNKSRSLEPMNNLAMWSSESVVIELLKGDKGLGFSILDYQDPVNPTDTVIVIRSLVPGGVAQQDGRLVPGDRLVSVNDEDLEGCSLDEAVQVLKGAPKGVVRIGVAKPLPLGNHIQYAQEEDISSGQLLYNNNKELYPGGFMEMDTSQLPVDSYPETSMETGPEEPVEQFPIQADVSTDLKSEIILYPDEMESESVEQSLSKPVTSPRFHINRRQQLASGPYANDAVVEQVTRESKPVPSPRQAPPTPQSAPDVPQKLSTDTPLSVSPELAGSIPLPTYEEAIADDIGEEISGLNPSPSPPAPPTRAESEHISSPSGPVASQRPVVPPKPTKKCSPRGGQPPPVPPKPTPPKILLNRAKEPVPPPLPTSLPPSLEESSKSAHLLQASTEENISYKMSDSAVDQSPASSPRTMSPVGRSPLASPCFRRTLSGGSDSFPVTLEKKLCIKKQGKDHLGLSVECPDRGYYGCQVKAIQPAGTFGKDGTLKPGDYIVSINNESLRKITNAQARAIIRRASLQGLDVEVSYVPSEEAHHYIENSQNNREPSPVLGSVSSGSISISPLATPRQPDPHSEDSVPEPHSPRQKSLASDGSPATGQQSTWGPLRSVELTREPNKGLGISIVGGRVDLYHVSQEHAISGIFIKHVLNDSPAGKNGTLKTGDRILEVDDKDLRNASHDQAVEIIRNAKNPVKFVVQSLCDQVCPNDLERDSKPMQASIEAHQGEPVQLQVTPSDAGTERVLPREVTQETPTASVEEEEDSEEEDEFGYTHKRLQRRYGEIGGQLHLVDLHKSGNGLGLSLAGNKDRNTMSVFVAGIQPESVAGKDGRIHIGDELLEVNGQELYGRSHLNASAIIKGINTPLVKLVLVRRDTNLDNMAVRPIKHQMGSISSEDVSSTSPAPSAPSVTPTDSRRLSPSPADVIQCIHLQKGGAGLGFAIEEDTRDGHHGIYVRSITAGGVAAKDGQLSVGDQILEVGDQHLHGVHYDKAIEILRNSQGTVSLKVRKVTDRQGDSGHHRAVFQLDNAAQGESSTDAPTEAEASVEPATSDPFTCPIVPGQETTIAIEKGHTGLGLSIVGGSDTLLGAIIIHEVYDDGAAARDGRLWAGDQVLEVNNEDLRDATHDYAIQVLRQTPATVQITVFRDDNLEKEEDIYNIFTVDLMKKPGRGLGLSIVGKKNDVGVYISDIVKGGVAEADARLMQGDQILAVNNEDMRNATQEYAATVLKTTMGRIILTVGRLKAGSRSSSRKDSTGNALKKSESSASNKSKGKHAKSLPSSISY